MFLEELVQLRRITIVNVFKWVHFPTLMEQSLNRVYFGPVSYVVIA